MTDSDFYDFALLKLECDRTADLILDLGRESGSLEEFNHQVSRLITLLREYRRIEKFINDNVNSLKPIVAQLMATKP
jgi:hypothetical protein